MVKLEDSIIVVGGLARDCEANLLKNLNEILKLKEKVKELFICILENDSSDKTPRIMDDFCRLNENVIVKHFSETEFDVNIKTGAAKSRICRLAKYRNMLLDLMERCSNVINYNVIIDWDLDELDSMQILNAIEEAPSDWGAIFADGRYKWQYKNYKQSGFRDKSKIYDTFALLENDMDIETISFKGKRKFRMFQMALMYGRLLNKEKYVKCTSAFGGIGIYKHDAISGCRYSTLSKGDWYVCEHIFFNNRVRLNGYQNYICSEMITSVLLSQNNILFYLLNRYLHFLFNYLVFLRLKKNGKML